MSVLAPAQNPSIDGSYARNNTKVYLVVNGQRVGRIQSVRLDQSNNVQVLDELGRDVAVELKKGITHYSFSVAKFYARNDVFSDIRDGAIFSLAVRDTAGVNTDGTGRAGPQVLEFFQSCMVQTVSFDYTAGAVTVGLNANIVTIGRGIALPNNLS